MSYRSIRLYSNTPASFPDYSQTAHYKRGRLREIIIIIKINKFYAYCVAVTMSTPSSEDRERFCLKSILFLILS